MGALAGPFFSAAGLLVSAGILKVRRPDAAARVLGEFGLPSSSGVVRALGGTEVAIGASALLWASSVTAGLLALCYVGFAVFAAAAMARTSVVSGCGCFGRDGDPPTVVHVVLTSAAAVVAAGAAVGHIDSLPAVVSHQPLLGLPFLVLTAVTAWLAQLALTVLPGTMAVTR
jgi:hypothetical protein